MSKTEYTNIYGRARWPGAPHRVLKTPFFVEWRNLPDHENEANQPVIGRSTIHGMVSLSFKCKLFMVQPVLFTHPKSYLFGLGLITLLIHFSMSTNFIFFLCFFMNRSTVIWHCHVDYELFSWSNYVGERNSEVCRYDSKQDNNRWYWKHGDVCRRRRGTYRGYLTSRSGCKETCWRCSDFDPTTF